MKTKKIFLISFSFLFLFSFTNCNFLNSPIETYLKKYTNEISIGNTVLSSPSNPDDKSEPNYYIPSTINCVYDIYIANPQNHEFSIYYKNGYELSDENDSNIKLIRYPEDSTKVSIQFSSNYLSQFDKEDSNVSRNVSNTFYFKDNEINQTFPDFSINFTVNTPPEIFNSFAVVQENGNNYILCMSLADLSTDILQTVKMMMAIFL